MSQQQHPAVLPLYAAFLVDDQLWMVLPYVSGGSAEDILKRQGTPVRVIGCVEVRLRTDPKV
jgi:serine/threonine protein kinase